jgi:hypothetical protein
MTIRETLLKENKPDIFFFHLEGGKNFFFPPFLCYHCTMKNPSIFFTK